MSRHRIVRRMNYEDECCDDDDDYGHSYEDRYSVSPSTAAQFTYNRDRDLSLSNYMQDEIPEETEMEMEPEAEQEATGAAAGTGLTDVQKARLQSCVEEVHSIMGDTVPEAMVSETILRHDFNLEATLNELLARKDAPKSQRTPKKRKDRTQGASNQNQQAQQQQQQQKQQEVKEVLEQQKQFLDPSAPRPVLTLSTPKRATKGFAVDTNNSFVQQSQGEDAADRLNQEVAALSVASGGDKVKNPALSSVSGAAAKGTESPSSSRPQTPQKLDHAPMGVPRSASRSKNEKIDAKAEYAKRQGDKELINLVVIGHVDAGKSTLMGHLLYQLGSVHQRTMHKYEQESRKLGKSSFAFAWVLDETDEERSRGVTMDVAQTRFVTEKKMVTLLDAPGHKDFIPNMITGAAQADVAILVINATRGEFETGFESGGQTREHALLARSLGVSQIIVAVNKMDTVDWGQSRYEEIVKKLRQFLKQVGFKEADLSFVPCSGLGGENLTKTPSEPRLTAWYTGPTLVQQIDQFKNPERPVDKPFRLSVSDVFKGATGGFSIGGRVSAGYIRPGDKVMVMPAGNIAGIKNVTVDDLTAQIAFAGDHVTLSLTGIDMSSVNIGFVLCDLLSPSHCATRIRAKIVIFNLEVPVTRGYPVVFHYQCINEPAIIKRLVAILNKSTGEVVKNRPKCLTKNSSAIVEVEFERTVCVEMYTEFRDLGRFMLRSGGHTIAAGMIEEILQGKVQKDDQN
ncbi:HBS1-like protein isoform X2 [Littorina saxatilis]|uniref:Tr-type G domain-containing protein n=1 Tax=Littorina saxatilis TaxID=31220 RepID=A0AAN9B6P7_9CAEN